jgi:hypothetical protein
MDHYGKEREQDRELGTLRRGGGKAGRLVEQREQEIERLRKATVLARILSSRSGHGRGGEDLPVAIGQ